MTGHIVVGVDGSDQSRNALRWALDEARLRGAEVEAVQVWDYPVLTYIPGVVSPPTFAHDDLEAEARTELDQAVDAVLDDVEGAPGVERVVIEGSAAEQLLRRAGDADLLVVGHRGRGGFADLMLGSVAHQVSAHATCPVVIVRDMEKP